MSYTKQEPMTVYSREEINKGDAECDLFISQSEFMSKFNNVIDSLSKLYRYNYLVQIEGARAEQRWTDLAKLHGTCEGWRDAAFSIANELGMDIPEDKFNLSVDNLSVDKSIFQRQRTLRDGEPCSHKGCLSHISHPCEGCGRIGGRSTVSRMREALEAYQEQNNLGNDEKAELYEKAKAALSEEEEGRWSCDPPTTPGRYWYRVERFATGPFEKPVALNLEERHLGIDQAMPDREYWTIPIDPRVFSGEKTRTEK